MSDFSITANDGVVLYGYRWLPDTDQSVRGVIGIVHGLAEHAARYERTAKDLNMAGYAVFSYDQRGHGNTVKPPEDLGYFAPNNGWQKSLQDIGVLLQTMKQAYPETPVFLLGHSMGSFMLQNFIMENGNKVDGVMLSGSNGRVGIMRTLGYYIAKIERMRLGPRGRSDLLHFLSFGAYNKAFTPSRTQMDWLSRDTAEVDKYIEDPLCGFVATTQLWIDFLWGLGVIEDPSLQAHIPKNLPIYIFSGEKDPVSSETKGLLRLLKDFKRIGLRRVHHRFYPDARHETLNEINRDQVLKDLIEWLDETINSTSS